MRESGKRRTPASLVGGNLPPSPQNTYRRAIWQRTFGASRRTINARPALFFSASAAPAVQDTDADSPDDPEALSLPLFLTVCGIKRFFLCQHLAVLGVERLFRWQLLSPSSLNARLEARCVSMRKDARSRTADTGTGRLSKATVKLLTVRRYCSGIISEFCSRHTKTVF